MLRQGAHLFVFLTIAVSLIFAQYDPTYCPNGATPGPSDPRWVFTADRFEMIGEIISSGSIGDLSQAFSTTRDSVALNINGGSLLYYWNFATQEQFEIVTVASGTSVDRACIRQPLTITSQTSVIAPGSLYVKPSVLLGYNAVNQRNPAWFIQYLGTATTRDIPALKFQSCFYIPDIDATASVVIHTIDQSLIPVQNPDNQVTVLKMEANILRRDGKKESFVFNVFRQVTNPNPQEVRQALETPTGVFCPGRDPGMPVPQNLPERGSSNTEGLVPEAGASIFSSHGLYDTEYQVTRSEFWFPNLLGTGDWQHISEIHDFSVGLRYTYDYNSRQCSVDDLILNSTDSTPVDGKPNLVEIATPQQFFGMKDAQYQYTGEKPCRDRYLCHVWIAEVNVSSKIVEHREWYWAFSRNDQPLVRYIPMKYVLKRYVDQKLNATYDITIYNYRTNPFTIVELDFNLAECYRAMGPANNYNLGVLSFRIDNQQQYPIMRNLNYFRLHVFETLVFALFVRPTRLSNLVVDKELNDIVVTFTLLDAPPRTGPVEKVYNETSYDELVDRLEKIINANGLAFRARANDRQVILRAKAQSLNVVHQTSTVKEVSSGPRITTFWIVFIIVGLLVGVVGGIFVMKRMTSS